MNKTSGLWAWQEVVEDKKFQFFLYTLMFTTILINLANKGLTYIGNVNNETIFTYNYSLGPIGIILAIPAAFTSLLIMKVLLKLTNRIIKSPIARGIGLAKFLETGGISDARMMKVFRFLLKIIKWLFKAMIKMMIGFFKLIFMLILSGLTGGSSKSGGGSYYPKSSYDHRSGSTDYTEKSASDARFQARQKQKAADYAWRQAKKQGNYNPNTHHFDNRVNHAANLQREANKAKKRL